MRTRIGLAIVGMLAAVVSLARAADPIVVCAHVPMTGAAPIPRHESRFGQFYFDEVNANGGVDGRPVTFLVYDDRYFPAGARAAAERCHRAGAHVYVGPFGGEQAVSVARWAAARDVVYLHATTAEAAVAGLETGMLDPSVEDRTALVAATIDVNRRELGGRRPRIGLVRTDAASTEVVRDTLRRELRARGMRLAADVVVQQDEQQYARAWTALGDPDVVVYAAGAQQLTSFWRQRPVILEPALIGIGQDLGFDAFARANPDVPIVALHALAPTLDDAEPWASEIEEFRRIFAERSPEQQPPADDMDWMSYLRARQIHRFVDAADGDLSTGHLLSMLATYAETPRAAYPSCALDFTAEPGVGTHATHLFRNVAGRWRQAAFCAGMDGADIAAPTLRCDGTLAVAREVRCAASDRAAGIRSIVAVDAVTGARLAAVRAGCARGARLAAHATGLVRVVATDCAGNASSADLIAIG